MAVRSGLPTLYDVATVKEFLIAAAFERAASGRCCCSLERRRFVQIAPEIALPIAPPMARAASYSVVTLAMSMSC